MADESTGTPQGTSAQGAGSPPTPPAPSSSQPPAEDWSSRYAALERERDDYKGKYEKYKQYGEPEYIGKVYDSVRQINADFQAGKLSYAQAQAAKEDLKTADPFEGYEDLSPREQAQRMRDMLRTDLGGLTKQEMDAFRKEMKDLQVNLGTQQQLLFRIIQLKTENPDLDIDELLKQSTEAAGYGPQQILELQARALRSPKEQERAIQKAIEEAKTKWQQEQDAKRVPLTTRRMPRLAAAHEKADPIARRMERVQNILKRSDELNSRKVS